MSAIQTPQAPAIHENSTAVKERRLRTSMNFTSNIVAKHAYMRGTRVSTDGALVYSSRDYSPLVVRERPFFSGTFRLWPRSRARHLRRSGPPSARACYGRPRAAARRWPPGIPGREGHLYSGWQQYLINRRTSDE